MSYGILIVEDDGTNWVETYRPFNVIDQLVITGTGSVNYQLSDGEQLVLVESATYQADLANGVGVRALNGRVTWPISKSEPIVSGEQRCYLQNGGFVLVLKKR